MKRHRDEYEPNRDDDIEDDDIDNETETNADTDIGADIDDLDESKQGNEKTLPIHRPKKPLNRRRNSSGKGGLVAALADIDLDGFDEEPDVPGARDIDDLDDDVEVLPLGGRSKSGGSPAPKRPKAPRRMVAGGLLEGLAGRSKNKPLKCLRLKLIARRDISFTQLRVALLLLEVCKVNSWKALSAEQIGKELDVAQSHVSRALKNLVDDKKLFLRCTDEQAYSYRLKLTWK